jgi:hypothetical protein
MNLLSNANNNRALPYYCAKVRCNKQTLNCPCFHEIQVLKVKGFDVACYIIYCYGAAWRLVF